MTITLLTSSDIEISDFLDIYINLTLRLVSIMKSNINYKKNLKIDVRGKRGLQLLIKALETKISKIVAKRELEIYRTTKKKYSDLLSSNWSKKY